MSVCYDLWNFHDLNNSKKKTYQKTCLLKLE